MREDGPRPSPRTTSRLAADVGADVADLRTSLRRALDEAEELESAGRHDLAVAVLEDQRAALADLHVRLSRRLADAAVEREAEHVLSGATPASPDLPASPTSTTVPTAPAPAANATPVVRRPDATTLRLLASAVAAVVGVTVLVTPDLGGDVLRVAGWATVAAPVADPVAAPTGSASPARADDPAPVPAAPQGEDDVPPQDRAVASPAPGAPPADAPDAERSDPTDLADVGAFLPDLVGDQDGPAAPLPGSGQLAPDDAVVGDDGAPSSPTTTQNGVAPSGADVDDAVVVDQTVERRGPAR